VNTREISRFDDWDEQALSALVGRYVRTFRRLPSYAQLMRFRRAHLRLEMRIEAPRRRHARLLTVVN
jgi:hypothetical protein